MKIFVFLTFSIFFGLIIQQKSDDTINLSKININDSIVLEVCISKFNPQNHSIDYWDINGWQGIGFIDNNFVFGNDWEIPFTKLQYLRLFLGQTKIDLEVSAMFNPNGTDLFCREDQFIISAIEGGYLLEGYFSDGAGAYHVTWIIFRNKSIRTLIENVN
jgi:hypothetical protein